MTRTAAYVAVCAFLVAALAVPLRAAADPIGIDQQNTGPRIGGFGVAGDISLAQTFTVGITGNLTALELGVFNPNDVSRGDPYLPDPLRIELRNTSSGSPGGIVLYSWTLPLQDATLNRTAFTTFGGASVNVAAGQTLAIVLTTGSAGNYGWSYGGDYIGGSAFESNGSSFGLLYPVRTSIAGDFLFRTYVDPSGAPGGSPTPEPASVLLLGTGVVAVARKWLRGGR